MKPDSSRAVRCRPRVASESHKLQKSTAVGRKSWLFQGHLRPLDHWELLATEPQPEEYFTEVPARLLSTAIIQIRELLPAHGKLIRGTLLEGLRSGAVRGVTMKKIFGRGPAITVSFLRREGGAIQRLADFAVPGTRRHPDSLRSTE
jgi:hypothetical protein